jgi:heat shock protein HslJ
MRKLVLLSLIAMLVTACLGSDFADSVEGSWQMTTGTVDGEEIPLLDSHPITITIEGDQVSGTAACNGYGGTFELDGSEIAFGGLAMTEMACIPEQTMEAEAMFVTAISRVDIVAIDDLMTLSGDGVELVFETLESGTG